MLAMTGASAATNNATSGEPLFINGRVNPDAVIYAKYGKCVGEHISTGRDRYVDYYAKYEDKNTRFSRIYKMDLCTNQKFLKDCDQKLFPLFDMVNKKRKAGIYRSTLRDIKLWFNKGNLESAQTFSRQLSKPVVQKYDTIVKQESDYVHIRYTMKKEFRQRFDLILSTRKDIELEYDEQQRQESFETSLSCSDTKMFVNVGNGLRTFERVVKMEPAIRNEIVKKGKEAKEVLAFKEITDTGVTTYLLFRKASKGKKYEVKIQATGQPTRTYTIKKDELLKNRKVSNTFKAEEGEDLKMLLSIAAPKPKPQKEAPNKRTGMSCFAKCFGFGK